MYTSEADLLTIGAAGLRLMADSAEPRYIPGEYNDPARLVAPYADGRYRWPAAQLRRFGQAVQVPITVTGDPALPVGDVERGDLTPEGFAVYLAARLDRGEHWHACYASIDTIPLVRDAVRARGIDPAIFGWWAANPTDEPHLYPGSVATQFRWLTGLYDESLVRDRWHPAA